MHIGITQFPGINPTAIFYSVEIFLFFLTYKSKIKPMQDFSGQYNFPLFIF